jgi:hypothetical protein
MAESYEISVALAFDEREAEQLKKLPEEVRRRWEALNQEIQKGAPLEGARGALLQQSSVRLQELGTRASAQGFVTPAQSAESQRLLAQQQRIWKGHWDEQERIAKQGSARLLDEIDRLQKEISQAEKQGDTQRQQQLGRQLVQTYQQYERGGEDTAARVEEIRRARRFQQGQFEETRAQFQMFPTAELVSPQRQQRAQQQQQRQQEREERAQAATGLGGQARSERYQRDLQTRQERVARIQERQQQRFQREQGQVERLEEQAQEERLRAATAQIRAAREAARATQVGTPLARAQAAHEESQLHLVRTQAELTRARAAVARDPFASAHMAAAQAAQTAAQAQVLQTAQGLAEAYGQQQDPTQQRRGGMFGFGFLGNFGRGLLGASVIGGGGYLVASRVRRDFSEELQRGMGVADLSQRLRPAGMPYDQFRDFAGAIHPSAAPAESTEFLAQYSGLAGMRNLTPQQMMGRTTEAFGLTRGFGFAPEEGAKLFGGAERLGVDQRRLAESMGEEIARAQMKGREGEMFDAVIRMSESLVERLGRSPDVDRIAGVLGRLGESGMPGLQGAYGAQRVQGFEQAVQGTSLFNMPDLRTPLLMGAMVRMGISSPAEMMRIQEEGPLARPDLARALFAEMEQFGGIEGELGPAMAGQLGLPRAPKQFRAMERALTTPEGEREIDRLKKIAGDKTVEEAFKRAPYEVTELARRAPTMPAEKVKEALGGFAEERRPEVAVRQELADLYQTEAAAVRLAIPAYAKAIQGLNKTGEVIGSFNQFIEERLQEQGFTPKWATRGADAATAALVLGGVGMAWKGLKTGWSLLSGGAGGGFTSGAAVETATRSVPFWRKAAAVGVGAPVGATLGELLFPSETAGPESELTPEGFPKAPRSNVGALLGAATPREPSPEIRAVIHKHAARVGVHPLQAEALASGESAFDPTAVSSAGARGLYQIMPGNEGPAPEVPPDRLFDPAVSAEKGLGFFKKLLDKYGDENLAVAAYNRGPGKVPVGAPIEQVLAKADADKYPETRRLVERYQNYQWHAEKKLAGVERTAPTGMEPRGELTPEQQRLVKAEPRSERTPVVKPPAREPHGELTPQQQRLVKTAPQDEPTPAAQRLMKATGVEPRGDLTPEAQRLVRATEGEPPGTPFREKADTLLAATLAAMERAAPRQQQPAKTTGIEPRGNLTPEMQRLMKAEPTPKTAPLTEAIRMAKEAQQMQIGIAPLTIVVRNERGEVLGTTTAQPEIRPIGDYGAPTTSPTAVVR